MLKWNCVQKTREEILDWNRPVICLWTAVCPCYGWFELCCKFQNCWPTDGVFSSGNHSPVWWQNKWWGNGNRCHTWYCDNCENDQERIPMQKSRHNHWSLGNEAALSAWTSNSIESTLCVLTIPDYFYSVHTQRKKTDLSKHQCFWCFRKPKHTKWSIQISKCISNIWPWQAQRISVCYWKVTNPSLFAAQNGFPVFSEKNNENEHQCCVYGLPVDEYKDLIKVFTNLFLFLHVVCFEGRGVCILSDLFRAVKLELQTQKQAQNGFFSNFLRMQIYTINDTLSKCGLHKIAKENTQKLPNWQQLEKGRNPFCSVCWPSFAFLSGCRRTLVVRDLLQGSALSH